MQDLRSTVGVIGSANSDGHYYNIRDITNLRSGKMQTISNEGLRVLEEETEKATPSPLFARKNSMRNKPCPCKSGKKFKKCCWYKFNGVTL